jgi:N-acetylglucosamine malate deacetylase 1
LSTICPSILAIGAHPDDIELGCGGSIAKLASAGARVHALIFSKGRRGSLSEADRAIETETALCRLGVQRITVCDFKDTMLWMHVTDLIEVIERHVAEVAPERVYTMFKGDRHQDHRAVFEASAVGCRNVHQFLGYETPSSYPNFRPTVFEQIDLYLETKVEAIKTHVSQGKRLYMQEEKIRAAAQFRGAQVNLGPCEGFVSYKMII